MRVWAARGLTLHFTEFCGNVSCGYGPYTCRMRWSAAVRRLDFRCVAPDGALFRFRWLEGE